jgi:hypothetical protein
MYVLLWQTDRLRKVHESGRGMLKRLKLELDNACITLVVWLLCGMTFQVQLVEVGRCSALASKDK